MTMASRANRLQAVLHIYLQALDRDEQPDRQRILNENPDLREELAEYFADASKLDRLRKALKTASFDQAVADASAANTSMIIGTITYFGDYELLEEIARGGMGVVYKARQMSLNRPVALKTILKGEMAGEADVRRFRQEAEAAANLDHPNIVPIYEVGEQAGQQYFSMKLIERGSWKPERGTLAGQRKVAALVATVARAVHHAHQRGILHRDLKPSNILIDKEGEPHVADFGLAKRVEEDSTVTKSGTIVGTPAYMAPEQARAEKGLTTAIDVYSLGAILYEWLTGRPPFRGEDVVSTLLKLATEEPIRPRALIGKIDGDLETICLKCLSKGAKGRYASAEALAEDLERWLHGQPISARRVGWGERLRKWAQRRPATAAAVLLALLLGIALIGGGIWIDQERRSRTEGELREMVADAELKKRRAEVERQNAELARQKAELDASTMLAAERRWQTLLEQARGQRLEGNRWQALELLAEAARLRRTTELEQEAFRAVNTAGVRWLRDIVFVGHRQRTFAPDGSGLLIQSHLPGTGRGKAGISLWPLPDGEPRWHPASFWDQDDLEQRSKKLFQKRNPGKVAGFLAIDPDITPTALAEGAAFATLPDGRPVVAVLLRSAKKKGAKNRTWIHLWDPQTGKEEGELDVAGDAKEIIASSFDPCLLALDGIVVYDLRRPGEPIRLPRRLLGFVSANEVLLVPVPAVGAQAALGLERWDLRTARQVQKWPAELQLIARSASGRCLALAAEVKKGAGGGPVEIWDAAGRRITVVPDVPVAAWRKDKSVPTVSDDGRWFAFEEENGSGQTRIWDALAFAFVPLKSEPRGLGAPALGTFGPHGLLTTFRIAEGQAGPVTVHDLEANRKIGSLDRVPASKFPPKIPEVFRKVIPPVWSADGRRLLTTQAGGVWFPEKNSGYSSESGLSQVWEVAHPNPSYPVGVQVHSLHFAPDGLQLAVNGALWEVRSLGGRAYLSRAVSQSQSDLAAFSKRGTLILHLPRGEKSQDPVKLVRANTDPPEEFVLPRPAAWNGFPFEKAHKDSLAPVGGAGLSPSGRYLCLAYSAEPFTSRDFRVLQLEVWDLDGPKPHRLWQHRWSSVVPVEWYRIHKTSVAGPPAPIFFSPGEATLTFMGHLLTSFETRPGQWTKSDSFADPVGLAFRSDGGEVAVALRSGETKVHGFPGQIVRLQLAAPHLNTSKLQEADGCVAISPGDRLLAIGGPGRAIRLLDYTTGDLIATWEAHAEGVSALAFSPDGRTLVSAGLDGTLKVWNLAATAAELSSHGLGWKFPKGPPWDAVAVAEAQVQRTAAGWLEPLRLYHVTKPDLLEAVRQDTRLAEPVRLLIRKQAEAWIEKAPRLNRHAWKIVIQHGQPREEYERALKLADRAAKLPDADQREYVGITGGVDYSPQGGRKDIARTRGAALFRLERFEEALQLLDEVKNVYVKDPSFQAFLAMTQHRQGRKDEAAETLTRLRSLLEKSPFRHLWEAQLREAAKVIGEKR